MSLKKGNQNKHIHPEGVRLLDANNLAQAMAQLTGVRMKAIIKRSVTNRPNISCFSEQVQTEMTDIKLLK